MRSPLARVLFAALALLAGYRSAIAERVPSAPAAASKSALVMVMLDGFRWDSVDAEHTPNLERLARAGVRGEMIPVWPSISSPNHWAMATGLHPVHGGVYDNEMYDPVAGKKFSPTQSNWGKGEPIWAAVVRQGGIVGVIAREGWAGSQMNDGRRPSFRIPYFLAEGGRDNRAQIVVDLLDQDSGTRPDLILLYAIEVDHAQHKHGLSSAPAREARQHADQMIGNLVAGIKARGLAGSVNIVIVSDHGHIDIPQQQVVYVDQFVDLDDLVTAPLGGLMALWPKAGRADAVYQRIRNISPHIQVLRPADIPARMRCCDLERAPPVLLLPDPGWVAVLKGSAPLKSTHGYDNTAREMHAIFIAAGPAIRPGARIAPFEIVDIYSLAAELLHVEPVQNDGSLLSLCPILANPAATCPR